MKSKNTPLGKKLPTVGDSGKVKKEFPTGGYMFVKAMERAEREEINKSSSTGQVGDSEKHKYVRFGYDKRGVYRALSVPKPCYFCTFAELREMNTHQDEFVGCVIKNDIQEGKAHCPHGVIKDA